MKNYKLLNFKSFSTKLFCTKIFYMKSRISHVTQYLRLWSNFNPNQAKLFWPLRNQGGKESGRSSFCKPIMLTFQLGPLFFICRHFLDIFWPLRNQGGEESRRSSFCKPIMLIFQLGPLLFFCRHFLDIL